MADLTDLEKQSLEEIAHPSLPEGSSIYGGTKVFPDYQAENDETYFTLVHGIAHESSVSFVAVLQATRAQRKGFESAIYFYGPGSLNCLATRGFPTTGSSAFPGEHNINNSLKTFMAEGGKVYCCRFGLSLHGAREEDLIEGVIPTHPLDVQVAFGSERSLDGVRDGGLVIRDGRDVHQGGGQGSRIGMQVECDPGGGRGGCGLGG